MSGKGKSSTTPSNKRTAPKKDQSLSRKKPNKDDNTSVCLEEDEISVSEPGNSNMESILSELKDIKIQLGGILKEADIEKLVSNTVTTVLKKFEDKLRSDITTQMKEMISPLQDQINYLIHENKVLADNLKQQTDKNSKSASDTLDTVNEHSVRINQAIQMANYNEQYSRKNNIKIRNIPNDNNETEEELTNKVCSMLTKAGTELRPSEILAIHRLPGKPDEPKTVIIKTTNNAAKSRIMRKRKEVKQCGYKLADDVTRLNSGLINRLLDHKQINSAWFFNGSVYGLTNEGERMKFDIFDCISKVINDYREKINKAK